MGFDLEFNFEPQLKNSSLALCQLKGGVGKTTILANLAAISAMMGWRTAAIDLDNNGSLTGAIFKRLVSKGGVIEALERIDRGETIDDLFQYSPETGIYVLPGSVAAIPAHLKQHIPTLIKMSKDMFVAGTDGTYDQVDFTLIDAPGGNRDINAGVLAGVDYVVLPVVMHGIDIIVTTVSINLVAAVQKRRNGSPIFLGMILNRVQRGGFSERSFLGDALASGEVLPYIPNSDLVRMTFFRESAEGGQTVVQFAPKSAAAQSFVRLWTALNNPTAPYEEFVTDLKRYIKYTADGGE